MGSAEAEDKEAGIVVCCDEHGQASTPWFSTCDATQTPSATAEKQTRVAALTFCGMVNKRLCKSQAELSTSPFCHDDTGCAFGPKTFAWTDIQVAAQSHWHVRLS